jgi:hypothetical protein
MRAELDQIAAGMHEYWNDTSRDVSSKYQEFAARPGAKDIIRAAIVDNPQNDGLIMLLPEDGSYNDLVIWAMSSPNTYTRLNGVNKAWDMSSLEFLPALTALLEKEDNYLTKSWATDAIKELTETTIPPPPV